MSAFASPLPLVVLAARQPIPNEPKADALLVVSGCGNDPKSGAPLPLSAVNSACDEVVASVAMWGTCHRPLGGGPARATHLARVHSAVDAHA